MTGCVEVDGWREMWWLLRRYEADGVTEEQNRAEDGARTSSSGIMAATQAAWRSLNQQQKHKHIQQPDDNSNSCVLSATDQQHGENKDPAAADCSRPAASVTANIWSQISPSEWNTRARQQINTHRGVTYFHTHSVNSCDQMSWEQSSVFVSSTRRHRISWNVPGRMCFWILNWKNGASVSTCWQMCQQVDH